MNQADRIRETALERYVQPARIAGREQITIRAGDLHSEMKLTNAMPAVCSALRGRKFEQLAGVKRLDVTGPVNGANVFFRFDLAGRGGEPHPEVLQPRAVHPRPVKTAGAPATGSLDLSDALVLVSCVKSKLPYSALARLLYCSDLFTKMRDLVEAQNARWFVLSALHGLVSPDQAIAPYELTLKTVGVDERRAWAAQVFRALEPELRGYKRVVFFAGQRYRAFLVGPIQRAGLQVEVPMERLAFGEQLAWLSGRQ